MLEGASERRSLRVLRHRHDYGERCRPFRCWTRTTALRAVTSRAGCQSEAFATGDGETDKEGGRLSKNRLGKSIKTTAELFSIHDASDATIITRACSGSFTVGSRGRTKPFSTTPLTARGRRRIRPRWLSIEEGVTSAGSSGGASCGSLAICSSRARRSGLRWSIPGVVICDSSQYAVITKIGTSPNSPKTSGISSSSRSYRQITQIRWPDGISANISKEPSLRSRRLNTRSNAASTSSAERPCASIFSRFHSIHLNCLMHGFLSGCHHDSPLHELTQEDDSK